MAGEFVTDVKEIRRRARAHMEQGPVTAGYQADRETVVRLLNEALATESRRSSPSTPPRSRRTRIRSRSASRSSAARPTSTPKGWPPGVTRSTSRATTCSR